MIARDRIDELVDQWRGERPDLDSRVMATFGRLVRVAALVNARFDRHADAHGLTRGEGDVLFALRRSGPPHRLPPGRLAEALLVASGTMTARLDRLEARGLIERLPNPADRRSVEVALTKEGRRLADEAVTAHVEDEQRMIEVLSDREREQLDRLLRKLYAHLAT